MTETRSAPTLEGWYSDRGEIADLIHRLLAAFEEGEMALVTPAFREFQKVILGHLSIEEEVVFPKAEESHPGQAQPIHSLRLAHIGIRADIARIGEQIERSHLEAARAMLDAFLDSFGAHERLEDQLFHLLKSSQSA